MVSNDIIDGVKNGAAIALGGSLTGVSGVLAYPAIGFAADEFMGWNNGTETGVALGAAALLTGAGLGGGGSSGRRRM